MKLEFEKYTLANGLKVILNKDIQTPLATINILYNVGAKHESPERTGFAHLFEHLMFGGSVNIPSYDSPLQIVGGENNAFTNNDYTNYYLTLPAQNLETGLWLESDRMLELDFSQKNLDVQRSVVIEEYKQRYLNQPYGDIWLLLRPLAYRHHPYQWPTIGKSVQHIQDARLREVRDFFFAHYAPNNAILSMSGNVDLEKTRGLIEKWFGSIPPRAIRKKVPVPEPIQTERRVLSVKRDIPQHAIYMVYHMSGRMTKDFYSADLMTDILSSGKSSRLFQKLVLEEGIFTDINAYVTGEIDEGLVVFSGKLKKHIAMEQAESAILQEIDRLKKGLVTQRELTRVKNKSEASMGFSLISGLNKAMELAYFEHLGDADLIHTESDKVQAVEADDILNLANRILREENSSILYYQAEQ